MGYLKFIFLIFLMISCSFKPKVNEQDLDFSVYIDDTVSNPLVPLVVYGDSSNIAYFLIKSDNLKLYEKNVERKNLDHLSSFNDIYLMVKEEGTFNYELTVIDLSGGTVFYKQGQITYYPDLEIKNFFYLKTIQNSQQSYLYISGNNIKNLTKIKIEGDIDSIPLDQENGWYQIPSFGLVPFKVTTEEGIKNLKITFLNIYEQEIGPFYYQILVSKNQLLNCSIDPMQLIVDKNELRVRMKGSSSLPIYWKVEGDLNRFEKGFYTKIEKSNDNFLLIKNFKLSDGNGYKKIEITIKDEAENYCFSDVLNVLVDSNHEFLYFKLNNGDRVTLRDQIKLNWKIPFFDEEKHYYSYKISGDLSESKDFTKFQNLDLDLYLTDFSGQKSVKVLFKNPEGKDLLEQIELIYLKPEYYYNNGQLIVPDIYGTKNLTIEGCGDVLFFEQINSLIYCAKSGNIKLDYLFDNGQHFIQ